LETWEGPSLTRKPTGFWCEARVLPDSEQGLDALEVSWGGDCVPWLVSVSSVNPGWRSIPSLIVLSGEHDQVLGG
jgi:hypothetical protein